MKTNNIKITDFKIADVRQEDSIVYINMLVKGYTPVGYITLNIRENK